MSSAGAQRQWCVTGARLAAVKYKLAFDRYIHDRGYTGIRSLVAFSGTVEDPDDPGSSYTEVSMNDGLAESELPGDFRAPTITGFFWSQRSIRPASISPCCRRCMW